MENLTVALKHVSQAVNLDSSGFQQAAFSKYIQSLQVLILCLNNTFSSLGFEKMLEKKREVMQILSMVHECSDRISVILNEYGKQVKNPVPDTLKCHDTKLDNFSKFSAFEAIQSENMKLFKLYKMRLEKANDKYTKANLNLEYQRRLAENAILAKKKYDIAVKQLQKERLQIMETTIRKLYENSEQLNEREIEKRELYHDVLKYVKTETWPCSWRLGSHELSAFEMAEKIFTKIIRCCEHPLTQWLILVQTNIKRKADTTFKEYQNYINYLPDLNSGSIHSGVEEHQDELILKSSDSESLIKIPLSKMLLLENTIKAMSADIRNIIGDTVEIFYLVYKSLLPDESETICYHIIEKYFLKSMWPNLSTLFRILNMTSECRISENMFLHQDCDPSTFEIDISNSEEFYKSVIAMLKTILQHQSLVNKLRILVQVSQKIGDCEKEENNCVRKLGADEIIPILCYVIVQSQLPQLSSECNMLEHLFDMKYMLGEEGYALSTFLGALKYIEIMKLTDCGVSEEKS